MSRGVATTTHDADSRRGLMLAIEVSNPSADLPPTGTTGAPAHDGTGDVIGPSVALARAGVVIDQEALRTPDSRHDDDLMPAIDRMVRRAGLRPRDLERVAVSIGPGGFTGIRVSIATAKAIGEAIIARGGDPACCVGVPTALVAARAVADSGLWPRSLSGNSRGASGDGPTHERVRVVGVLAVALASKRDTAFVTLFAAPDGPIEVGAIADAPTLERLHKRHVIALLLADRFLPDAMRASALRLGIEVRPPALSAAACARAAGSIPPVDPALLLPLYPREPEAVTKWRAMHGGSV